MSSRKPDYRLRGLHTPSKKTATLGAAWQNQDGSISIVFDPFIKVEQADGWSFRLFPQQANRSPQVEDDFADQEDRRDLCPNT